MEVQKTLSPIALELKTTYSTNMNMYTLTYMR